MKTEETLIVTFSILGMAETGTGVVTHIGEVREDNVEEQSDLLLKSIGKALGAALQEVAPHIQAYHMSKYGNPPLDDDTPQW